MAVGGIALVVVVFVTLLSLAAGFQRVVEASGSPRQRHRPAQGRRRGTAEPGAARHGARHQRAADRRRGGRPEAGGLRKRGHSGAAQAGRRRDERHDPRRAAPRPRRAHRRAPDARPLVHPRLERGGARRGPGPPAPGRGPGPDDDHRPQHLAHRRPVRGRRQLAGIRTLDGRRPAAEHVSPRRRLPVRAVPRRRQRPRGGRPAQRADATATSASAPCRP